MTTDGRYDKNQDAAANARADVTSVQSQLADPDKALTKLRDEANPATGLKGVDATAQEAYRTEYTKQLQEAGVLPALSVQAVRQLGDAVKTDGALDPAKLVARMQAERDPMQKALLGSFMNQYDQIKRDAPGGRITDDVLKAKLDKTTADARDSAAMKEKQTKDKAELGDLLTKPELFNAIAGSDGRINKEEAQKFMDRITKGTSPEDQKLRDQFAKTPEEFERLKKTTQSLINSFDNPRNQDDKKGSVLVENDRSLTNWFGSGDYMTRDSLSKGMGFNNPAEAADALKKSEAPRADVPRVTDYNTTVLRDGQGPWHVAQGMLKDQRGFFKDQASYEKAQKDLTEVMRKEFKDKSGQNQVTTENRDRIHEELRKRNPEAADWFASRYPKIEGTPNPAGPTPDVQRAADYSASKVIRGQGSDAISRKLVEGQNLDDGARRALQGIINNKDITGIDLRSAREGTELINAQNVEKIRQAVEAANNPALKAWFNKRYPKA